MDQDYFDSRDVIERIEELESMEELFLDPESSEEDKAEWTRELDNELGQLRAFVDSVGSSEFNDGMTFIADSYFTEYAEELCVDLGISRTICQGSLHRTSTGLGLPMISGLIIPRMS